MSETLGEKLRQAREARGLSISDVAEQTRISALYLSCIENDDYRTLPGGIFNKGFVKSFAKSVGVDEQEALQDYARLIASQGIPTEEEQRKTYRSEVLTDESNSVLNAPTIIGAILILALMTGGILFLLNYLQKNSAQTIANTNSVNTNVNAVNTVANVSPANVAAVSNTATNSLKVDFKADGGDIYLSSSGDDKPRSEALIKNGDAVSFQPQEKLTLSFAKERLQFARLTLNDKQIALPKSPAKGKVTLVISKENVGRIMESGQIDLFVPPASR